MTLDHFVRLLKDAMGLDVASVGTTAVERAIAERLRARQMDDLPRYWACVQASEAELRSLVDAVAVPETWFFRDPQAFAALGTEVLSEWQRESGSRPLRLLSLPCSTGEEAYSMAMALLDSGLPPPQFRIDALDISERALTQARRGVFGTRAFRTADLGFRDRYFTATPGGYRVADRVRETVCFERANLLSPDLLAGRERYDVVFCRNVLIYFDRETQSRAVDTLSRLLRPEGFLFVGGSESGLFLNDEFVSAKLPMAFAFRKARTSRRPTEEAGPARRWSTRQPRSTSIAPRHAASPVSVATVVPSEPLIGPAAATTLPGLEEARRLADEGRFVEAAVCCNAQLERDGPSPGAYYLLGLVRDASGNHSEAAEYYRKVLYLDPDHADALLHLALLLEADGEAPEARLLRDRIRRLKPRGR